MRPSNRSVLFTVLAALIVAPTAAAGGEELPYRHPVDAEPITGFDSSANTYGPGSRGIGYNVAPGQPVLAAGSGTVVFAGLVAGQRYVTIQHLDGLRSTYSYLDVTDVIVGEVVERSGLLGFTSERFKLTFRRGATYVDPGGLIEAPRQARLVDDIAELTRPSSVDDATQLLPLIGSLGGANSGLGALRR